MVRRNRRRTLIGVAALVFGASGTVASGAFTIDSQGGLGDNWVQVAGTDQSVTFDSPEQVTVGDESSGDTSAESDDEDEGEESSEGTADDGTESDDDTEGEETDSDTTDEGTSGDGSTDDGTDGDDPSVSTTVEVLVDPSASNGLNSGGPASWDGSIFETEYVTGTDDGYLDGIRNNELNQNATTKLGTLNDRPPGDEVVFVVANIGPEDTTNTAPPVTVTLRLLFDGGEPDPDQIRFPYRVLNTNEEITSTGDNLAAAGGIELDTGELIEVVIVFDTTDGSKTLERLSGIQFFATE